MIPASAQGATKLLEVLEKLSQWAGEPSGERPSGAPSRELVRAFEEALSTAPAEGPAVAAAEGGTAAPVATTLLPGPAESMPCPPLAGAGAETSLPPVEQAGNGLAVERPAAADGADVPAGQAYQPSPSGDSAPPLGDHKLAPPGRHTDYAFVKGTATPKATTNLPPAAAVLTKPCKRLRPAVRRPLS